MLNFEELDNNYAVEFDLNKTCRFAYLWNKKDSIYNPNNEKFITVSEAYRKLKDLKYHFPKNQCFFLLKLSSVPRQIILFL